MINSTTQYCTGNSFFTHDVNSIALRELETNLQAWINNSDATGNKEEAARRIIKVFQEKLDELRLDLLNLNYIPDIIGKLHHLKRLYLRHNNLSTLPDTIGNLGNLQKLFLTRNKLNTVPATIGNLQNVRELYLDENGLSTIPDTIGNLLHLERLNLGNNNLSTIPETIGKLHRLKWLYLGHNNLSTIPATIGNLHHLERLYLEINNLITVPATIGNLQNLEWLNLSSNNLSTIPDTISNLQNLKWLYLGHNNLSTLPDTIGNLGNLQKLFLTRNNLNTVPATIGNFQNLRKLDLEKTDLSTIPNTIGNLQNLELLNLNYNQCISIPQSIGQCLLLKTFTVKNNPSLQDLPISIGNIPGITYINIENTLISLERINTILNLCKATREREAADRIPEQLKLWCSFASKDPKSLDAVLNFTDQEKIAIYEWLIRLSNCSDFSNNQKGLAEIACAILLDTTQNPTFKETFIAQIIANNARCGDRAAMGLNVLYVSWCILCPQKEISLKQQLELLAKAGKTLALREALGKQMQEYELANPESLRESTEIYLYYETHLKDSLGLLTAVETMLYEDIGRRDWIDIEKLISEVQKNYFDQMFDLPIFEQLLEGDSTAVKEMEKIKENYTTKMAECENSDMDCIAKERDNKLKSFKKEWFEFKLKA